MRVAVVGGSGAGKTTLARELAARLGVPHVELDALNWTPGWRGRHQHEPEAFRAAVAEAVAGDGWVADGNYTLVQDLIRPRATHLIWLDYPRPLILARVIRRSIRRALDGRELWPGTGNVETAARWLRPDHPIRWTWSTFHDRRRRMEALFKMLDGTGVSLHRITRPWELGVLVDALTRDDKAA